MRKHVKVKRSMTVRPIRHMIGSGQYSTTSTLHHQAVNRTRLLRERAVLMGRLKEVEEELRCSDAQVNKSISDVEKQVRAGKKGRGGRKKKAGDAGSIRKMKLEF